MVVDTTGKEPLLSHLAAHPYFRLLTSQQRDQLAQWARLQLFNADEIIFSEGDSSTGLWIIESGHVKIYQLSVDGQEHILHLLGPGQSFNDIAAIDRGPNPANAAALSLVKTWFLSSAVLLEMLQHNNAFALGVIDLLAQRVRGLAQQIENLTLYSSTARLARFLLQQAENPEPVSAGVTRKAIAAHLGTTPETISRALRTLQEAGAIRFDRHRILITSPEILYEIAMQ